MKLYTFKHSPNPLKVRLALAELGLEYEPVEINLFEGEHHGPSFSAINPHHKVPVLVDGDLVLPESNAILAYLGRTRGGALWPSDPKLEATSLRWLFFDSFSLGNQCGTLWWSDVVAPATGRPPSSEPVIEDAVRDLETALGVLERHLDGRDYLLGGELTLADCAVGVGLAMLAGTRLGRAEGWPRATAYRDRLMARPSFTQAGGDGIRSFV